MVSQGETFRVIATITDIDGIALTPLAGDTHDIALFEPDGTPNQVKTEADIVHTGSGVYYVDFTMIPPNPLGGWRVIWTFNRGGVIGIAKLPFFVDDP